MVQKKIPILLLHDQMDASIPLCESLSLLASFKLHGSDAKLVVYDSFVQVTAQDIEKLRVKEIFDWFSMKMEV